MDIKYKIVGNNDDSYYLKTEGMNGIMVVNCANFFERSDILKRMYSEESCFMGFTAYLRASSKNILNYDFCSFVEPCSAKYKLIGYGQNGYLTILNSHTGEQREFCPIKLFQNAEIIKNINPIRGFYIGVLAAIKVKRKNELYSREQKPSCNVVPFKKPNITT